MAIARDGCIVDAEPLADLLNGFVANWTRQRPNTAGRFSGRNERTAISPVGPISWLTAETRLSGRGVPRRTILALAAGRERAAELWVADALVTALDRPDLFHDGTLTIRPNPAADRRAQAACCGGVGDTLARIALVYGAAGSSPQRITT